MKNKEIEEVLNELKDVAERHTIEIKEYGVVETIPSSINKELRLNSYSANLLLSYIEQLEECYCNRTDCIGRIKDSKKYDSLLQKYEQLQNNRDKAINHLDLFISETNLSKYDTLKILIHTKKLLKGDTDE